MITLARESGQEHRITLSIPIVQRSGVMSHERVALKATYFFGDTMPTAFLAIPPINRPQINHPPILALRESTPCFLLMGVTD